MRRSGAASVEPELAFAPCPRVTVPEAPLVQVTETPPLPFSAAEAFADTGSYAPNASALVVMMQLAATDEETARFWVALPACAWLDTAMPAASVEATALRRMDFMWFAPVSMRMAFRRRRNCLDIGRRETSLERARVGKIPFRAYKERRADSGSDCRQPVAWFMSGNLDALKFSRPPSKYPHAADIIKLICDLSMRGLDR
jgi:hypothetical protein